MTQYEITTIVNINKGEDGARSITNTIKDSISSNKGKIIDSDFWGKRSFTYPIDHQTEGYYEVINFDADPKDLAGLKQKLSLMDGLVRYLITAA